MTTSLSITLPDERRLGYARYGAPDGKPFLYFHGMPGSRYECGLLDSAARQSGLCIYALDRPGYGSSDWLAQRALLDWPGDVTNFADSLGLDSFGIIGVSGGGPYALACAHAMPGRLRAIGIVCGLGPVSEASLRKDMRGLARAGFWLADTAPGLLHGLYGAPLAWLAESAPAFALRLLAYSLGGADKAVLLRDDIQACLAESLRESFRQGPRAAERDVAIYRAPWGFELTGIRTRVDLWHGEADRIVPSRHSLVQHQRLANSGLSLVPREGHFSLPILQAEQILETLARA